MIFDPNYPPVGTSISYRGDPNPCLQREVMGWLKAHIRKPPPAVGPNLQDEP